jgi:uncharacterized protein (TIGR00251 family)
MATPGFLRAVSNGVSLAVKVQPRASRDEIGEASGDELKIKVIAPPVDSAANEALLRLLSEALRCPRSAVQMLRGNTSRHKVIFIQGMDPETVMAKLVRARS